METGYLNFHDEEHFFEFPSSLEQTEFSYLESHVDIGNSAALWGIEQELNGDMAVLPAAGVSTVIPKLEHIKEDFAKVLTDWHEHIGYLQASDLEELEYMNIQSLDTNLPETILYNEDIVIKHEPIGSPTLPDFQIADSISEPSFDNNKINTNEKTAGLPCTNTNEEPIHCFVNNKNKNLRTKTKVMKSDKRKRKKNEKKPDAIQKKGKDVGFKKNIAKTDNEDCIDVETVPDEEPTLKAKDVKSLFEKFEKSEKLDFPNINCKLKNQNKTTSTLTRQPNAALKKSTSENLNLHKNIRDSLPKEVIDRIKASGRKKVTLPNPPVPNTKNQSINGLPAKDVRTTASRSKLVKLIGNVGNIRRIDGSLVQLDHDYCSSASSVISSSDSSEYERQLSDSEKSTPVKSEEREESQVGKSINSKGQNWGDINCKKDSGLESGDVSDNNEESHISTTESKKSEKIVTLKTDKKSPTVELSKTKTTIIHSTLTTSILQTEQGVITKTKPLKMGNNRVKQMISVLKKPPNIPKVPTINKNSNESIVTTTNSLNDQVQNIIVQSTEEATICQEEKKPPPPRRKLNLAEYRSRREQNRSDSSRTNSPIQPMTLVYIHHASTTTESIQDNLGNPVWSEREIVSILKPKADVEEQKIKSKPSTQEIGIQTYETVFEFPASHMNDIDERTIEPGEIRDDIEIELEIQTIPSTNKSMEKRNPFQPKKRVSCNVNRSRVKNDKRSKSRSKSRSRSSSRSRSRSISVSRSRSRSRCRNRDRSRSKSRNRNRKRYRSRSRSMSRHRQRNTRRIRRRNLSKSRSITRSRSRSKSISYRRSNHRSRRISHRRSSISSSSSWSSRSRSNTRSSSSSRSSRTSRSRSRSYRIKSRSRSSSSSRYSVSSRSSCRSNFGRSKWSRGRRKSSSDLRRRRSLRNSPNRRDWRRSPSNHRRPSYNWCDTEKQRQVEERRVIYVGRLEEGVSKTDLRRRFETFGPVVDISVHFREHGDNYGFVTFAYKNDAYEAVEHGNDDPKLPRYDLCFGGRRAFCKVKYADLDGIASTSFNGGGNTSFNGGSGMGGGGGMGGGSGILQTEESNTFDSLLREVQAKLRKRKV